MTDSPSAPDSGANPPPPPVIAVAPEQPSAPRPRWVGPTAIGVVIGLVVAFGAVLVTRGDDNRVASDGVPVATDSVDPTATDPTATEPTEVATTTPDTVAAPPATTSPDTAAVESTPPATEAPTTAPPTTAPPTTAAPPTTDAPPATEPAPAATTPPEPTGPADDGFVRIGNSQYPIVRTCRTEPFAPRSDAFVVFSYLFLDDAGAPQIVDHWFDEGGVTGGTYSDNGVAVEAGYEFLGADDFAMNVRRGDSFRRVVVNPPLDGAVDCGGHVATNDVSTPDFSYTRAILDVCFGSQTGPLQYIGYLSQGGRFSAIPNGDGTVTLNYAEPFVGDFVDPAATSTAIDGGLEVRGRASSEGFNGPVTHDITVTIRAGATRDCAVTDVPF